MEEDEWNKSGLFPLMKEGASSKRRRWKRNIKLFNFFSPLGLHANILLRNEASNIASPTEPLKKAPMRLSTKSKFRKTFKFANHRHRSPPNCLRFAPAGHEPRRQAGHVRRKENWIYWSLDSELPLFGFSPFCLHFWFMDVTDMYV